MNISIPVTIETLTGGGFEQTVHNIVVSIDDVTARASDCPLALLHLRDRLNTLQLKAEAAGDILATDKLLRALNIAMSLSDTAQLRLKEKLGVEADYTAQDGIGYLAARLDDGDANEDQIILALGLLEKYDELAVMMVQHESARYDKLSAVGKAIVRGRM